MLLTECEEIFLNMCRIQGQWVRKLCFDGDAQVVVGTDVLEDSNFLSSKAGWLGLNRSMYDVLLDPELRWSNQVKLSGC